MVDLYQIYLITDQTNNKKYVGQVIQHRGYLSRFAEHLNSVEYANTRLLSNAIKKHGKEMFSVELIESDIPESEIDEKEKYYINSYNTFYTSGFGYNMTVGGQGVHGYKHTNQDKEKISKAGLAYWQKLKTDPEKLTERNLKISNKLKGVSKSEETKKKLSEAAKKRFTTEPGTFKGKKHSEHTKHLIAEKNGFPIGMYDKISEELLKVFVSAGEAGRYVIESGLTRNKSASTRILTICNGVKGQGVSAYGYKWKFLNKSVSTIPAGSKVENQLPLEVLSP